MSPAICASCKDFRHRQLDSNTRLHIPTSEHTLVFAVLEKGYAMYGDQTPNPFLSSIALKLSPHVPQITPITLPLPSKNQSFSIPPTPTPLPRNNPYRYAGLVSDPQTRICTYLIDVRNKFFFLSLAFLIWRALILDRICRPTPPLLFWMQVSGRFLGGIQGCYS